MLESSTQKLHRIPEGFLIAIEGIDGSGKSTIGGLLAQYFGERGIACALSKEPTSGKYGAALRDSMRSGRHDLEKEIELFIRDRQEHVDRLINPALQEGSIIILDRYYFSSAAYQGERGADPAEIIARNEEFAPQPDLLLLIDVPADGGLGRITSRGDKPNKFETNSGLSKARKIFLNLDKPYLRKVDGTQALHAVIDQSIAIVREMISQKIQKLEPDNKALIALIENDRF